MRKAVLVILAVFMFPIIASAERVGGHWRDTNRDGLKDSYIQPYYRSDRNNTTIDNYSTRGNTNPYTGERGTIDPYKSNNNTFSSPYSNPYSSPKSYSNPYSNPFGENKRRGLYDFNND